MDNYTLMKLSEKMDDDGVDIADFDPQDLYFTEDDAERFKEKYKEFLPQSNIICVNKTFENCFEDIPNEFDLLLSNHSIDDMIIAE